jgi:hypothetical protein
MRPGLKTLMKWHINRAENTVITAGLFPGVHLVKGVKS